MRILWRYLRPHRGLITLTLLLAVARFGTEMFNDGLKHTLRLSFVAIEERSSGEMMGLLQKVRTDTERFAEAAVSILYSSFVGIGFVTWYGVTQSWLLIPVFGVGVVVLGGLTGLLSQKIKTVQRSIVRETARLFGTITVSLRNIELVKSLGLTWPEIRRLQGHTRLILDLEMQKVRKMRGLSFLQSTIINVLRQSILFILLWLIFCEKLSTGDLISFQLILNTIFGLLQHLGRVILRARHASGRGRAESLRRGAAAPLHRPCAAARVAAGRSGTWTCRSGSLLHPALIRRLRMLSSRCGCQPRHGQSSDHINSMDSDARSWTSELRARATRSSFGRREAARIL